VSQKTHPGEAAPNWVDAFTDMEGNEPLIDFLRRFWFWRGFLCKS